MAYCPNCKSQYQNELPYCPGCGKDREPEAYLATVHDGYTLVLLSEDLDKNWIPYRIDRGGPVSFKITGSLQGGKIYVPERLLDKARAVLKRFDYELSWDPTWEDLKPVTKHYKGNPEEDARMEKSKARKAIYIYLAVAISLPAIAVLLLLITGVL